MFVLMGSIADEDTFDDTGTEMTHNALTLVGREGLLTVEVFGRTDRGLRRQNNEDAFCARPDLGLVAVADGAGGLPCGEIASALAIEELVRVVEQDPRTRPSGDEPSFLLLLEAARRANTKVRSEAAADEDKQGMCTTLCAALFRGDHMAWAHLGDSRILLLRDGELMRLTTDHNALEERLRQGLVVSSSEREVLQFRITRSIGLVEEPRIDCGVLDFCAGDVLLLATDGLTSVVCEERIAAMLSSDIALADLAFGLITTANEAGGPDNITVVLVDSERKKTSR